FTGRRWRLLLRKELLVLRRDPLLLMRCSMQVVSLIPALVGVFWFRRTAGIAGIGLVAPGLVAVTLVALMNANDEGHEFTATSPLSERERAWAMAVAAATPLVLLGWAMAAVVLALGAALPAAMVAVGAPVNAVALAWLGTCTSRPHTAEEKARNRPPRVVLWQTLLAMLLGGIGTGGVGACDAGQYAIGIGLFTVATMCACLLFLVRPRPPWSTR
ncbi:MAG TPA: hypothetical protein VK348_02815, partial [Planctomycetota bacterium]|nr:hypothetical protein [Planctomycetota bacterium]